MNEHLFTRVLIDTDAHNEGHLAIQQALAITDLMCSLASYPDGFDAIDKNTLSNALFTVIRLLGSADSLLDFQPLPPVVSVEEAAHD